MEYIGIKLQKTLQDSKGHVSYADHDQPNARCPICGEIISSSLVQPALFKAFGTVQNQGQGVPKSYLLIIPGTTTRVHLVHMVSADTSAVKVELFRGTTVSANGTPIPALNNDDNSATVAELQLFVDPTVTDDGDVLSNRIITGAQQRRALNPQEERIYLQNTIYQLKITPLKNNTDISVEFNWMEVR